jgi:hypothetical protein
MAEQLAGALRGSLAGGGFGALAGRQAGLGAVLPKQLAPGMDEGQLLEDFIRGLASIEDATERFKVATLADARALLPQIELYRRHRATIEADTAARKAIADPQAQQDAQDLAFQVGRVGQSFTALIQALAKPFLKDIAGVFGRLADKLRDVALWANNNSKTLTAFGDVLKGMVRAILNFVKGTASAIELLGKGVSLLPGAAGLGAQIQGSGRSLFTGAQLLEDILFGAASMQASAAAQMSQAAKTFGNAVQAGTYGGGSRTARAMQMRIPGLLGPGVFDRAVAGGAYRLGAF